MGSTAGPVHVHVPSDLAAAPVTVSSSTASVWLALHTAATTATVAAASATVPAVAPAVSVKVTALGDGVKEDIVLADATAPAS